jgi:hypothetical protein
VGEKAALAEPAKAVSATTQIESVMIARASADLAQLSAPISFPEYMSPTPIDF